jgi:hypothetical protein
MIRLRLTDSSTGKARGLLRRRIKLRAAHTPYATRWDDLCIS